MTLHTCIHEDGGYAVIEEYGGEGQYLPEGSSLTAKNRFEWLDTVSVDVLRLNSTSGASYSGAVVLPRADGGEPRIKLDRDGWITALHFVLPTRDYVMRELDKDGSVINTYERVWCADSGRIYLLENGSPVSKSVEALAEEDSDNTTVSRCEGDWFRVTSTEESADKLIGELIESRMGGSKCGGESCKAFLLLHALNLTAHHVRTAMLAEAQRVLEKARCMLGEETTAKKRDPRKENGCGCL